MTLNRLTLTTSSANQPWLIELEKLFLWKKNQNRPEVTELNCYYAIFSTSDRIYQMCYCCRKLDFQTFSWERMRERMHESLSLVHRDHMMREQMREQMRESRCRSGYYFSTSDWLRQITWLKSALSHPLLHPLSCIRSHLSCDLSEPIRFAKVSIRSRESAPICDG